MSDLLRSIQHLDRLVLLYLPRASSYATSKQRVTKLCAIWPTNLRELHLNGGFIESNYIFLQNLPPRLSALWFENCPRLSLEFVKPFFDAKGAQLDYLRIGLPARCLSSEIMPSVARNCTYLRHLSVNIEILDNCWDGIFFGRGLCFSSVERLDLDCLEDHNDDDLDKYLVGLSDCLHNPDTGLPSLRKLMIHRKLKWAEKKLRLPALAEIDDLLKALAREDDEDAHISEDEAGLGFFGQR